MTAIADTGFFVAFLNSRDRHHRWAVEVGEQITQPVLTCEAVLTETAYLLNSVPLVIELLESGLLEVRFNLAANRSHVACLAVRYADLQPDLCDLCVVRMSELFPNHRVITTDRRDFSVYRRNQRDVIPLLCPPEA